LPLERFRFDLSTTGLRKQQHIAVEPVDLPLRCKSVPFTCKLIRLQIVKQYGARNAAQHFG